MGYPNIQHSHPSCALWLFCALRSQISHDATQIKHNSGFFGLGLSISSLHSYHGSRASVLLDVEITEITFNMRAVAAGASPCHFSWPTWRFSSFCSAFAPSLGLGFHDASTPFCRLGFHDASAPFCRLGFQIRLDCFGLSRLLLVQLLLVHSSSLLLRSSCASARRSCWCVASAVGK